MATPKFDVKELIATLSACFEDIASDDSARIDNGYQLFETTVNLFKGDFDIKSDDFCAALVAAGLDVPRFQDCYATAESKQVERAEQLAAKAARKAAQVEQAKATIATLDALMKEQDTTKQKVILSGLSVDLFCSLNDYDCNRPVEERAEKQAKKTFDHFTSDVVAIGILDPVKNKETWEAVAEKAKRDGMPSTLPYFIEDAHTRKYGWTTPHPTNGKTLFDRPDNLFFIVHMNHTDDEFYRINREYCNGVGKETNTERQQSADRKTGAIFATAFVGGESWKTAYKEVSRYQNEGKDLKDKTRTAWDKNPEAAAKEFYDIRVKIDSLKVDTKESKKKFSGVRAALIVTWDLATKPSEWFSFWKNFYAVKKQHPLISDLLGELGTVKSSNTKEIFELCIDAFREFTGKAPQGEEQEQEQETE